MWTGSSRKRANAFAKRVVLATLLGTVMGATSWAGPRTVFEDPGIIKVVEGRECIDQYGTETSVLDFLPPAEFEKGTSLVFPRRLSWTVPSYANRATVFLNGFGHAYDNKDHHVQDVEAAVFGVELAGRVLEWSVWGRLIDKNADDAAEFCLIYTALAWNSREIDARVDTVEEMEGSVPVPRDVVVDDYEGQDGVELQQFEYTGPDFRAPVAVLPRGFEMDFGKGDHHVLQVGYSLKQHRELSSSGPVRWRTYGILKDDSRREYQFRSFASLLGGPSVDVVPGTFDVKPLKKCGSGCIYTQGERRVQRERVTESGLDYDYVIPMLTGFDLSYERSDEHVAKVGAWLDNISFDPRTGDLAYDVSTVLLDRNAKPGFHGSVGVTLLALNRKRAPTTPPTTTDVTISRPMIGSYRVDWCASWATSCGKPAADYYCRSRYGNQAAAVGYQIEPNIGSLTSPTLTQVGLEVCNQSFCGGFLYVTCRKPWVPPAEF